MTERRSGVGDRRTTVKHRPGRRNNEFFNSAKFSWQSARKLPTPQFQIVDCACHDDATQAQHRVGALSPMSSCLGIGGHTGGSRHGHPRYTSAHTVGRSWVARLHTSTWHCPKQIHEVTNTGSVIRAHGSGACYGRTAEQDFQRLPGTGTPRTKSCQPWRSTSPSWMTCPLSRPSSTTLVTQSIAHNHGREKVGGNAGFHGWKAQKQGNHDAGVADVVLGVLWSTQHDTHDPLSSRVAAWTTSVPDVLVSFEKKHLPMAIRGHDDDSKITTTTRIGCHLQAGAWQVETEDRALGQLPLHPHSTRIARGRSGSMEWALFAPRRVFHGQAALHHHRCTQAPGFHQERDHWPVADRHSTHHGPSRR